ncbi:helix-turn-helix domain-containing protein [Shewanella youngdeokensis]|uniref:AraC family transcriptional regulator n=1 Tax=Shewanella youngdeokensis TaxID=2999068 RepID=A0ABZ0K2S7_9GAMM|nr:AraC family transcriptional regulator [Shewanella sp. DAU334]
MLQWIHFPKSTAVAKYIECYWLIEKLDLNAAFAYPKLNPDPSAHLIITPALQGYQYQYGSNILQGIGSHWLFPHQQTFELDHTEAFIYLGVKFKVGALYSLPITHYCHPILDNVQSANVEHLASDNLLCIESLLQTGRDKPHSCVAQLDRLLLPWLNKATEDQHSAMARKAIALLDTCPITNLSDKLHCSQRTLERSFTKVTGLTMKQYQSMTKLEAMLTYLYQKDAASIDWVDVALKFGFSDQPHLIRQLKKQIGLTPANYVNERSLTIDVYGSVKPS